MKAFFTELFDYDHYCNTKIISVFMEHKDQISEKSIRLMSHMLNVHQIWNQKIQPGPTPYEAWQEHTLSDLNALQDRNRNQSLLILDTMELDQLVLYTISKGQAFKHPVRDILFQIINHGTYHRAQIAREFRQVGLEPLLTDYIYYKIVKESL